MRSLFLLEGKKVEKFKWLFSIIGGFFAAFFQQYGVLILMVAVAIVFDLVTGLIKTKVSTDDVWSSEKCRKGMFMKIALLAAMFFGFFLDWFIPYALESVHVELPFAMPFSMIISLYIVLNECISICENLYAANPEIMPKWIVSLLTNVKERLEHSPEESEG